MVSRIVGRAAAGMSMLLGLFLGGLAVASALVACALPPRSEAPSVVVGTGDVTAEDRTSGEFRHISVGGGLIVDVAPGSPTSVRLSAQTNLLPLIRTTVEDDQLIVTIDAPGISTNEPITLEVVAPEILSVALSGGAIGTLEASGEDLTVDVSGGARLAATGSATTLDLTASGGARAGLDGLTANRATVDLTGGATAELWVVDEVTGSATGGAVLTLVSPPGRIDVQTSSGGMVLGG